MSRENVAIVLDFDSTLFDTDKFFNVDMRAAFACFGLDAAAWEETSARAIERGYTLARHCEEAARYSSEHAIPFLENEARKVLRREFSSLKQYVYDDVTERLKQFLSRGCKLVLVSFGAPSWQRYKVRASGLERYFNVMKFTRAHGTKVDVIESICDVHTRVVFVDDRGPELDSVLDRLPYVETYHINRIPIQRRRATGEEEDRLRYLFARRNAELSSRHTHRLCSTLYDVTL